MKYLFPISFLLALSTSVIAQVSLTAPTSGLRHGDFLCRVEIPYESEGERGEATIWTLPDIPDDSPDHLQAIRSNGDTIVIYEEGRMLHYLMRGDTLYNKGEQSRRAYRILSQERPELVYPFQYGDSISGTYEGDCQYEGRRYAVSGSGYTMADGMGILTDGEDTLRHVLRLHLHDYFEDDYGNGTTERWSRDCFRWYCMGYRYPVHNMTLGFLPVHSELDTLRIRDEKQLNEKASEEELLTDSLKLRYFEDMIREAEDTRFVFVYSPTWYGHHDSGIDPIMELARRHGFLFLDFTDSAKYVHRNEFFYDGSHLNARGADEFTRDLIRELRKRNVID